MLNVLWSGMILSGILWAAVHGRLDQVTQGALASAKEAVSLCITMLGVMSLWTGSTGNRPRSGTDRTSFQDDEAGAAFPFSASFSGQ